MAFEVFELTDLDEAAEAEMVADPSRFFKELFASEGKKVNGLMMDEKTLKPEPTGTGAAPRPRPQVYHCESPPEHQSKWITIVL